MFQLTKLKKMKTALKLLLVLLLFGSIDAYSQDKIFLKGSKEVLQVDIIEIGSQSIRYKTFGDSTSIVFNIEKYLVEKVLTAQGDVYAFADPLSDPAIYADQKKNALKVGFFNVFFGSMQFAYERSLEPGKSIEATLGIIGAGVDLTGTQSRGATIKFGYKMIKTPDYYIPGMRASHILNGGYIKPEIVFNVFNYDAYSYDYYQSTTTRENSFSGAFVLNLGKQWIISNFLVDLYFGAGFGFASNSEDYYSGQYYGFLGAYEGFPIALTGGLKIGFLFK